jgi:hypothetical protein
MDCKDVSVQLYVCLHFLGEMGDETDPRSRFLLGAWGFAASMLSVVRDDSLEWI